MECAESVEPNDIQDRLLELARLRRDVAHENAELDAQITPLAQQRAANLQRLEAAETALHAELLAYMTESGDLRCHPSLAFRRTHRLVYDKAQVLEQLENEGISDCTRIRKELDVRKFEAAWRDGHYHFVDAEPINAPTLAISKLGDLLIAAGEAT